MKKVDPEDILYKKASKLDIICKFLFIVNVLISFILFIYEMEFMFTIEIIIALVYLLFKILNDHYFWYEAEKERRKDNISNGFNVEISEEKTEGYYNNKFEPSFKKYVANVFESNYFSREISKRMIIYAAFKCLFVLVIFIIAALSYLSNNIVLAIVQVLFSAEVIEEAISIICYYFKINSLYEKARNELVTVGIVTKNQYVWLFEYCMEYENIKSYYKVRLDTKIYDKLNEELSNNWSKIEKQIKFDAN